MGVAARLVLPSVAVAAALAAAAGGGAGVATAAASTAELRQVHGAVTVDWSEGTLTAVGGAAADLHMPSAELARPGAERRARAAALARLKVALGELPLGEGRTLSAAAVALACGRARPLPTEYQSNGGAVVRLQVSFTDWLPAEPAAAGAAPKAELALAVREMRLGAAPEVRIGKQEITLRAARYRAGPAPAGAGAVAAKVERDGRLAVVGTGAGAGGLAEKLAGAAIVIYVQKVLK